VCDERSPNVLHTTTPTVQHKKEFDISYEYLNSFEFVSYIIGKGKVIPITGLCGPEGG